MSLPEQDSLHARLLPSRRTLSTPHHLSPPPLPYCCPYPCPYCTLPLFTTAKAPSPCRAPVPQCARTWRGSAPSRVPRSGATAARRRCTHDPPCRANAAARSSAQAQAASRSSARARAAAGGRGTPAVPRLLPNDVYHVDSAGRPRPPLSREGAAGPAARGGGGSGAPGGSSECRPAHKERGARGARGARTGRGHGGRSCRSGRGARPCACARAETRAHARSARALGARHTCL